MPRRPAFMVLAALAAFGCIAAITTATSERRGSALRNLEITTAFSPNDDGQLDAAVISMQPRDEMTAVIRIVDADSSETVIEMPPISPDAGVIETAWDGTSEAGTVVDDGTYGIEVITGDSTITVPTRITVDTEPPVVVCATVDDRRVASLGALRIHVTSEDATDFTVRADDGTVLEIVRRIRNIDKVPGNVVPDCGPPVLVVDVPDDVTLRNGRMEVRDRAGNVTMVDIAIDEDDQANGETTS